MSKKWLDVSKLSIIGAKVKTYVDSKIGTLASTTLDAVTDLETSKQEKITGDPSKIAGFNDQGELVPILHPVNENLLINGNFLVACRDKNNVKVYVSGSVVRKDFIPGWTLSGDGFITMSKSGIRAEPTSGKTLYLTQKKRRVDTSWNNRPITLSAIAGGAWTATFKQGDAVLLSMSHNGLAQELIHTSGIYTFDNVTEILDVEFKMAITEIGQIKSVKLEFDNCQTIGHVINSNSIINRDVEIPILEDELSLSYNLGSISKGSPTRGIVFDASSNIVYTKLPANRNLFWNSNFSKPVNQRGASSYSLGWCVDKWIIQNNSGSGLVQVSSDKLILYGKHNDGLQYPITYDDLKLFENRLFTMSILTSNGELFSTTFRLSKTGGYTGESGTGKWLMYHGLYTPTNYWLFYPLITLDQPSRLSVDVLAAQLELGNIQTLAHRVENSNVWELNDVPPSYDETLKKCQETYQIISGENGGWIAPGSGYLSNAVIVVCHLPVTMKRTPTISTAGGFQVGASPSDRIDVTELRINRMIHNALSLTVMTNGGVVEGKNYFLQAADKNSKIILDAERF